MRVLLVSQYFWPETFIINDLVSLLHERGVDVTVLTGKPNYPGGRILDGYRAGGVQRETMGSIPVVRVPLYPRGERSAVGLALNYLSFIVSGMWYGPRILADTQFDLVFVYGLSPLLQAIVGIRLARWRKVPLVVWVQDLWPQSLSATGYAKQAWLLSAVAWVVRKIYRASDRILVQSRAFVPAVAALTERAEKIHYYPNLYCPLPAGQASVMAQALAEEIRSGFSVVFAGNLGTAQALDTVIDAAECLKDRGDIQIFLVGSGSMDEWLAQQASIRQLHNVRLCGRFAPADMPVLFEAASGLLVSLTPDAIFALTVPSKVQAYLAAGRPILACLDGEGARIVEEAQAGYCVAAGDAAALAKSIERLAACPAPARRVMGENGRRYFEANFAPSMLADALIEQFEQTLCAGVRPS